jgi:hypothetical protein
MVSVSEALQIKGTTEKARRELSAPQFEFWQGCMDNMPGDIPVGVRGYSCTQQAQSIGGVPVATRILVAAVAFGAAFLIFRRRK